MTEKRFELAYCDYDWWAICDKENPTELGISGEDVVELLNELDEKNEQLKKSIKRQQSSNDECAKLIQEQQKENEQLKVANGEMEDYLARLEEKNEQLKQLIKELEKQIYLVHMSSMFSTVKSFKGDVSKRYKYSEETDTIYDTANNYGQYDKVLDKKEIVMLLNEYETVLNELKGDVE